MKQFFFVVGLLVAFLAASGPSCHAENPVVRMETTRGTFFIELYPDQAPLTVANFLYYVTTGFYDGDDGNGETIFHRIVNTPGLYVVQGGGFTPAYYTALNESIKTTIAPILNESNNGLFNDAYTIAMARTGEPHSATSQFFINAQDNPGLNYNESSGAWGYAVFGKVTTGQEVIDTLVAVETGATPLADSPVTPILVTNAEVEGLENMAELDETLYFPNIASDGQWETEICVINTGGDSVDGLLQAYTDAGDPVSGTVYVSLPPAGRKAVTVGEAFPNPEKIGYILMKSDSERLLGYIKFHQPGRYRVAVPAIDEPATGDLFIPHIAADDQWWTGVSILNTTDAAKELEIEFNNGTTVTRTLAAKEHQSFTIRDLLGENFSEGLESAIIKSADGVVGLELFGSTEASGNNYLSGILLSGETDDEIIFPHVASDDIWWTGIVAYNPFDAPCNISIEPFSEDGFALSTQSFEIPGKGKLVRTADGLGLPENTAWFEVETVAGETEERCFISGFELFGKHDGSQLGGYNVVDIKTNQGVLPKIEKDGGWTGIALVNTGFTGAEVLMVAYNDAGQPLANQLLEIGSRAKKVATAEAFFEEADISQATYILFVSLNETELVAFQLNGNDDQKFLDALPGFSTN